MTATLTPDALLNELATPVLRLDAAGNIVAANVAAADWLGVGLRRLLGQAVSALECEGDALASALSQPRNALARLRRIGLACPSSDGLQFADVWLAPRPAGGYWMEVHPVDEFPGDDPALALPSAMNASLRGFAHELRNPLAGIKGAAQLLARRGDPEARELTGLIEAEVERLAGLVDRLLSPTPPRAFEPVNMHAVLERVLRLGEADAGWAVRLQRDYDPSLPELSGDADRLTQAVWNLVRNAIEAGARSVQLRTRIEHGARIGEELLPRALRLDIVDDGRGVPPELAEQVFLPLVSGRAEGSGLGLALAQQVAREHRGSLVYRSRPGHTVFTLLLPLPVAQAEEPRNG